MTAADLRSLVGDIRGKLGSDPAVVALIAEGEGDTVPYAVAANPAAQDLGYPRQRPGQAARCGRRTAAAAARPTWRRAPARIRRHRRGARRGAFRDRRDSAGRLSGLSTAPPARPARRPDRPRTGSTARHRRGQRAHRRGLQRPRRHPGHPGGNGPPRPDPASTCVGWPQLVAELEAVEVVVGLPRTLADRTGPSAHDAIEVADALARRVAPTPVRLADERLTTVSRAAIAARGRGAGQGTACGDRSGGGGGDPAELAGSAPRRCG